MNWSPEQLSIFAHFASSSGHGVVEALAGTGKTTTIKAAFEHAPEQRILYAVFNKKNQREAEQKITDSRVDVRTLHSLGAAYIKRLWPKAWTDIDASKEVEAERATAALQPSGLSSHKDIVAATAKLVGFLKNLSTTVPSEADVRDVADARDVLTGEEQTDNTIVRAALAAMAASKVKDAQGRISFDDMVWLPVAMNWVRPWFDLVVVDECQDMSLPQLSMVRQSCKPGGRIVVVGDNRQAIYGFRGAASGGMSMMRVSLRAVVFPLTVTYRCPKSVVALAKEIVPNYSAAPEAPEGSVVRMSEAKLADSAQVGDAILSRLNAPLMPLALALLRKNIPARIEGRDIGRQLLSTLRSLRANSVPDLLKRIESWRAKQIKRVAGGKHAEKKLEQINDVAATLVAVAEGAKSVADAESRLQNLFQDSDSNSKPSVVLSTVHKAKGLEWPRVFMLLDTFRRGKGVEEDNIYYVAVTRAMRELFLVSAGHSEPKAEPEKSYNKTFSPPPRRADGVALDSERRKNLRADYDFDSHLPGQRLLVPGSVVRLNGARWVSIKLGPGSAKLRRCGRVGEPSREETWSRQVDSGLVERVMSADELREFSR